MIGRMVGIGLVRFLLAIAVVLLHADFVPFEVAQIAVLTFFYISGFLMERSFRRYSGAWRFLVNRVLRLIPPFLFVAALTWIILINSKEGFRSAFAFIYLRSASSSASETFPPASFITSWEFDPSIPYLGFDSELIPQGWSIGHEMIYYLTIPLLAFLGARSLLLLLLASTLFLATQLVYHFDSFDFTVYTNLLATYPFFLAGYLISKMMRAEVHHPFGRRGILGFATMTALLALYLIDFPEELEPLLVIFATIALASLITLSALDPAFNNATNENRSDEGALSLWLGKISYSLYLSHMVAIGLLNYWSLLNPVAVIATSVTLAAILYLLVEWPVERIRIRLRNPANDSIVKR